jgi:surface antigen
VAFPVAEADAAQRDSRATQKQARPGQAMPQVVTRATPAQQAARVAAAKAAQQQNRVAVVTPSRTQPAAARVAAVPPPPPRAPARSAPQLAAPAAPARVQQVAMPVPAAIMRPAIANPAISLPHAAPGAGTPILPVSISSGLSCVPFARMATGMNISGDARMWWYNAAGTYARGNAPERGSVLAFTASGGMSRGHVAVVSRIVNSRTILIDHANWGGPGIRRGSVMRGVVVVDASDRNDWSAVRVQVGHDNSLLGRTYSTHGFIYNRPIGGGTRMMTAQAPRYQEVAEAETSPHVAHHARRTAQLFAE